MPKITITVPGQTPQLYRFKLDREVVTLGRGSENDIVINSGSVSTRHAEMRKVKGGYELRDVGSTNGMTVGGAQQTVIPLNSGCYANLGDVTFDFFLFPEEVNALKGTAPVPLSRVTGPVPVSRLTTPVPIPRNSAAETPDDEDEDEYATRSSGSGKFLLLLLLLPIAFAGGLGYRYHQETGDSLVKVVLAKFGATTPDGTK